MAVHRHGAATHGHVPAAGGADARRLGIALALIVGLTTLQVDHDREQQLLTITVTGDRD